MQKLGDPPLKVKKNGLPSPQQRIKNPPHFPPVALSINTERSLDILVCTLTTKYTTKIVFVTNLELDLSCYFGTA